MALSGARVKELVDEIRQTVPPERLNHVVFIGYFCRAFCLRLTHVLPIGGMACFGGTAYTDDEIDSILLPFIRNARDEWRALMPGVDSAAGDSSSDRD
jgi:hypothetical protein